MIKPVMAVENSQNKKIGEAAATYLPIKTCPKSCVFLNKGCYAQSGYCALRTEAMNAAAAFFSVTTILELEARAVSRMSGERPLRLHVSGDCPTDRAAELLALACKTYSKKHRMPVWTYTHNWPEIDREFWGDISVLASCESVSEVETAHLRGYAPALVSNRFPKGGGFSYLKCPAQFGDSNCVSCRVCFHDRRLWKARRVVFFGVHSHRRIASDALASRNQLTLEIDK